MNKEKYLLKIIPFIKDKGMSISMDAIAEGIGVSKKTLYNQFSSKEELIDLCIQTTTAEFKEKVNCLNDESVPVVDGFRNGIQGLRKYFHDISHFFMHDYIKLNPDNMATHIMGTDYFESLMEANIRRGQAEGVYRKAVDAALFAKYIASSIFSFYYRNVMLGNHYSSDYYFQQVTDFNLQALLK